MARQDDETQPSLAKELAEALEEEEEEEQESGPKPTRHGGTRTDSGKSRVWSPMKGRVSRGGETGHASVPVLSEPSSPGSYETGDGDEPATRDELKKLRRQVREL